jgi:hypothetical protein
MTSFTGSGRNASGRSLAPPIFHLSGVAAARDGDHTNPCWHVMVVHESMPGHSLPMIVKSVPSDVTKAVELACGLAAAELRLSVPQPGLVLADREDLPDLPDDHPGQRLLLVGSHYQRPDALFAQAVEDHPAAEDMVWQHVCASPVAKQGAAWDELIANPDRHCENVLFDGTTWWLFDHDQALPPAAAFSAQPQARQTRTDAIAYDAAVNQLADRLLQCHGPQPQNMLDAAKRIETSAKHLHALAGYAQKWSHPDPQVNEVLRLAAIMLGLIHLRLPALAEKLRRRVGASPAASIDLWNPPPPPN